MSKNNSEYLIERNDNVYEVVIGLEVHAQVTSNSKLFSSSSINTQSWVRVMLFWICPKVKNRLE